MARVLHTRQFPIPTIPRSVGLEILWGCNLKCNYCYVGIHHNWENPIVPDAARLMDIVDRLSDAGVQEVYLLGGEPTAHPQLDRICRHISDRNIPVRGICTNGTLINERIAQQLQSSGFYVDVSFRACDAVAFDEITGIRGSFERTLRGVKILSQSGMKPGIEFDCTPKNIAGLFTLIQYLLSESVSINQVFLHRISPQGDAKHFLDDCRMTLDDYNTAFLQARRIEEEFGISVSFEDGFPMCLTDKQNWKYLVPCECGTYLATIDPMGNVRRCSCHPAALGNIYTETLEQIWTDKLRDFRSLNWLEPACLACAMLEECRGGCAVSSSDCHTGYSPDVFKEFFTSLSDAGRDRRPKGLLGQTVVTEMP